MRPLDTRASIDEAWVAALAAAHAEDNGRLLHLVLAVDAPGAPEPGMVALNDELLHRGGHHSVDRVASTVFPSSTYADPRLSFEPDMPAESLAVLDAAAEDLYSRYRTMLPLLQTFDGNSHGTYFGRLVSWPGKSGDGYNQLDTRVRQLRGRRSLRWSSTNAADMTTDDPLATEWSGGLREYDAHDERLIGFPCLVHLDISVLKNRLSLLAVYRHWHLIEKAYGNLIGLTRLHHFLAQQTGYGLGELMVHATVANAQHDDFGKADVTDLLDKARVQLAVPGRPQASANGEAATVDDGTATHTFTAVGIVR